MIGTNTKLTKSAMKLYDNIVNSPYGKKSFAKIESYTKEIQTADSTGKIVKIMAKVNFELHKATIQYFFNVITDTLKRVIKKIF